MTRGIDKTNRLPRKYRKRRAKTTNGRQNQRLAKLEKTVFQSMERKSKTVYWGSGTWNVSETGTALTNANYPALQLDRGAESDELIGNKINLLNQTIRFCLYGAAGGTEDTYNKVRLMICEPQGETQDLAISDVLTYAPANPMVNSAELVMCSPYTVKTASGKRYKVHYDRIFELNANNHQVVGKIKIKNGKNGKIVNFPENLIGTQLPTDHNLCCFFMSDSGAIPHPKIELNVRSNYYDA